MNGKQAFEFGGNRGWTQNQDKAAVKLKKGKNAILVKCGNGSAQWEFSVGVSSDGGKYKFLEGGAEKFDPEAFRAFARSAKADAERGKALFLDAKGLACIKCHAVGGTGGNVGPALDGIGAKYAKDELMTSVLEPSKTIANGYETVKIVTADGKTISGVLKGETPDGLTLADAEGKLVPVKKKEIDERSISPVSVMPNGLAEGMTKQDFADLMAYLEGRREKK